MSNNLLGVGVSGLRVSQNGLSTVGHNIANADTEGYSRQRTNTVSNTANLQGAGYVGTGARVDSVERIVNDFVTEQMRTDATLFSDLDGYYNQIRQLDRLLADESTGLSSSLNTFFSALHNGADDPTALSSRQLVISEAENLADRFNTIHGRLEVMEKGVNSGMETAVSKVNVLAGNIAQLNLKITEAMGTGNGAMPNDLLDKRDLAVKELSSLVPTQVFDQGNSQVNVVIGNGQTLVVGTDARRLALAPSSADASKLDVVIQNGNRLESITNHIKGGELGGLLRFRDEILSTSFNELGLIAVSLSDAFNQAHQQGLDLDNNFGGLFFYDINDEQIARDRVLGDANNSKPDNRDMALHISDSSQLTGQDYRVKIEAGGVYRITREGDNKDVASGVVSGAMPFSVAFDGMELVLSSGAYKAGDSFTLQPVRSGASDIYSSLADTSAGALAFASPLLTDASLGNIGSGKISSGDVLALEDHNGEPLPLFAESGEMSPPLVVVFNSPTSYDILDNSDPGNPVHLDPPIRDQAYIPGASNKLFSNDPGQTQISTTGELIGLPDGSVAVSQSLAAFDSEALVNGYPSESLTFNRAASTPGGQVVSTNVITTRNASAAEIAAQLNGVPGVQANAMAYAEISGLNVSGGDPLQISLNGESLVEYVPGETPGSQIFASGVPNPDTDPDGFYDYIAARINQNPALKSQGIYAVAAANGATGNTELQLHSSSGGDLQIGFIGATAADTIAVSDGENPSVTMEGLGANDVSHVVVGGKLDIALADGLSVGSIPPDSMLFGDPEAEGFALPSYLGIQASISGSPDAGDRFTLDFNQDAAMDNRNALNLINLKDAKILAGGVKTLNQTYSGLVEKVGINTSSAKINRDAAEQVLLQTEELHNSISGVNLDEEAADLIRFEQLFSANAQVISVARDIFDRLLNSL